jgi:hypothetical protein
MIIFNFVGLAMLGVCFAIAYGIGTLISMTAESVLLVISGPLLFISDMVYRRRRATVADSWWYHHKLGGQLFFIPIWALGLFWMLLGTYTLLFPPN